MKKIGLINFQFSKANYGAVLQAAALEYYIKNMGYNVEHINFSPSDKTSFITKIKKNIMLILEFTNLVYAIKPNYRKKPRNFTVFDEFRKEYLSLTTEVSTKKEQLAQYKDLYDAVVVGSDQVWRPEYCRGEVDAFYLSFVGEKTRRVSYAASFGKDTWENNDRQLTERLKKEIQKFYRISVREDSGVKICENTFGVKAEHVLDPTLLVDKSYFEEMLLHDDHASSGVVYYVLDESPIIDKQIKQISNKKSTFANNIYYRKEKNKLTYNTVNQWLTAIANSEYIVTDSFHCVCFALIFEKQFIYSGNKTRGLSRLKSLFSMLEIEDRICLSKSNLYNKSSELNDIDYSRVNVRLESLKQKAYLYLSDSLR